ncbi:YodL domain-containing protein [Bacillus carboniphilus]|uniref:YodL domain-containing protein n=1 Tax=Bacillus carboniphilus TaxID=86663 RepID=A0ABY9K094_9BACI|nr:YodL domain-containing protein [Bacillus carboniphilus]WLR44252.1 YodL domain-containing protein [Bacillus carboniphilus]
MIFLSKVQVTLYDLTIFQTEEFGKDKGYQQVYRLKLEGKNHLDVLNKVFQKFNVPDRMPSDFNARYIGTGDIILIDEARGGKHYYKLFPGGWRKINRIHVR